MANHKSSTLETQNATSIVDTPALHQPFSWVPDSLSSRPEARFAAKIKSVAAGTKVIAQVLRSYVLDLHAMADGSPGVNPLLSPSDIDALADLAAVALEDLYEMADTRIAALEGAQS